MSAKIGFQNGRHLKSTFAIICGSNAAIDLILVSKCMFFGARNPMVTISQYTGNNNNNFINKNQITHFNMHNPMVIST